MKIIRYQDRNGLTGYAALQSDSSALKVTGDLYSGLQLTTEPANVAKLLAPLDPAAILCIGLNYRKHAEETGAKFPEFPVLFFKGINTLQNPDGPIEIPTHLPSNEVDYECELAVVIGRACKNVSRAEALDYVLGYTCCNDVSARDWQIKRGGGQWCRGKFFDTFCPLGPCLVTTDEIRNPNDLKLRT